MTEILKLFDAENSGEASVRSIIASLQEGGIYKARKALVELEYEEMNMMSMGGNPPEDRDQISEGLTRVVEKYGEEETITMLIHYLSNKLPEKQPADPADLLLKPRPMTQIETEYRQMLGKMFRQASWSAVKDALGELNISIDGQKATASKSEYDNLVAMESFFDDMIGGVFGGVQKLVSASKGLKEKGLLASKEEVAVALIHMREMTTFASQKEDSGDPLVERAKFESRKRKTMERIDKIVDELGLEAVEAHLTERLCHIADDLESPMLYPIQKQWDISPEMERAMVGLWGFDYDE